MHSLILDVESTTKAKGNPFHEANKLCAVGTLYDGVATISDIEYSDTPYGQALEDVRIQIEKADILVGFNIKFDLHWLRRYNVTGTRRVWDCQFGAYILSNQKSKYPSLDEVCSSLGLGSKHDIVRTEYWERGLDTTDVPWDTLKEYLNQDLALTKALFDYQYPLLKDNQIFKLGCEQLLVLEEMEWNGMLFDLKQCKVADDETSIELSNIKKALDGLVGVSYINWNSDDHISAVLYGGHIRIPARVKTERVLKNGTIKEGEKNGWQLRQMPQLVKPLKNTETLPTKQWDDERLYEENYKRIADGKHTLTRIYSVDKATLKSLPAKGKAKAIIDLLLRNSDLEKLQSTYFRGIPKIIEENGWTQGVVHGQFNQCSTYTGRLSGNNPNPQNYDRRIKELFKSRYDN